MNDIVCVVGFELRRNPLDDHGIECVCVDGVVAKNYIDKMNKKHPEYEFIILGDYILLKDNNG
jgi:hypothetical protein